MVSDDDMRQIVASTNDIRDACRRLIQRANERGGEDNITAVLIKIEQQDEVVKSDPEPKATAKEPEGAPPEETSAEGAKDKTGT